MHFTKTVLIYKVSIDCFTEGNLFHLWHRLTRMDLIWPTLYFPRIHGLTDFETPSKLS